MWDRVTAIFRDVFDDTSLTINETTTAPDIEGWDSFNHINLIMSIEEEFDISFATKEIGGLGSVKDLVALIKKKTL
jgi:acyl carrier protein